MSVFGLEYPTATATENVAGFPSIAARVRFRGDRTPLEIVRLLDNPHHEHINDLLRFVDQHLASSGPIGDRVLEARSQEEMAQALAEVELYGYLRNTLGTAVRPAPKRRKARTNDIDLALGQVSVRIEVYTPLELAGWQLFERNLVTALKYLDVDRGYDVGFTVSASVDFFADQVKYFYYPYEFPVESKVRDWFREFFKTVREWLLASAPARVLRIPGPAGAVQIELTLEELRVDPSDRLIHGYWSGRSNSTRLSFEPAASVIAQGEWGKKLRTKLDRRQCGEAAPHLLRLLVLNFDLGDESRFEFINTERFRSRFGEFVTLLVDPNDLPYDAVLPAVLGLECGFGRAALLNQQCAGGLVHCMVAAGLDRPVRDPPPGDPAELFGAEKEPRPL